jgi:[1-hydroxy-2-(trimethylamino)ethyl]phosphonate dioxygenase
MTADEFLLEIKSAFERRGGETYGEGVNQTDHALQAGWLAEQAGAPRALIVASLLHDIGHLIHELPQDIAEQGIDTEHESLGSAWLSRHFGPDVTEPVRLHVEAKRYLCVAEPGYFDRLSEASVLSLRLQGGPHKPEEAAAFAAEPYAEQAVKLRHWDEEAKVLGMKTPDFAHFAPLIRASLRAG